MVTRAVEASHTPQHTSIFGQDIPSIYEKGVKKIIDFLRSYDMRNVSNVVGTQLLEPWSSFKSALLIPLGWVNKFQFFGLNPDRLTPEQAKKKPLLLIHGNMHNQSAWLPFVKYIQNSYDGPIYTVNLNNGPLTENDRLILDAKIKEILAQYAEHGNYDVQIDIVGHSRGARMAFYAALDPSCWRIDENGKPKVLPSKVEWRHEIGNIVRIGYPLKRKQDTWLDELMRSRIYEIDGLHDCIVDERSLADPSHLAQIDCGHLELMHAEETFARILRWVKA